jgi:hypothetical protein
MYILLLNTTGTSRLKIMTLLNPTTRLDTKPVQSTSFVTAYLASPNDSEMRYTTHSHNANPLSPCKKYKKGRV